VYIVLSVDDDYQHILMGTPDHKYLWVMSRTPDMSAVAYNRLIAKATALNYNVANVQLTNQK
jgi:apolipoprotein D and lipocalin family protein